MGHEANARQGAGPFEYVTPDRRPDDPGYVAPAAPFSPAHTRDPEPRYLVPPIEPGTRAVSQSDPRLLSEIIRLQSVTLHKMGQLLDSIQENTRVANELLKALKLRVSKTKEK